MTGPGSVARAGCCENPIVLARRPAGRPLAEPTYVHVRCGTRRRAQCRYCSDLYEGDAWHVCASGYRDRSPYLWITLTAPGAKAFGAQHHIAAGKAGTRCTPGRCQTCGQRARCGRKHQPGDPSIGAPVHANCFNYLAAAHWNAHVSRLWTATVKEILRRARARLPRGSKSCVRPFPYIKVVEFGARGLIHVHVLVRGAPLPPKELLNAIRAARVDAPAYGLDAVRWGLHARVELLLPGAEQQARRRFSYVSKYVTKSLVELIPASRGAIATHLDRFRAAAEAVVSHAALPRCRCAGPRTCRRCRQIADSLGYAGHVLTKSHSWGRSFAAIRQQRRTWGARRERDPAPAAQQWSYAGRGWDLDHAAMRDAALAYRGNLPPPAVRTLREIRLSAPVLYAHGLALVPERR